MMVKLAPCFLLLLIPICFALNGRTYLEFSSSRAIPPGWVELDVASEDARVELIFALKQRNVDVLEDIFWAVSTPSSQRYGRHLTMDEISSLVRPRPQSYALVMDWLVRHDVQRCKEVTTKDFIVADVSVAQAKTLLAVQSFRYYAPSSNSARLSSLRMIRCLEPYSVPEDVARVVEFVGGVHRLPSLLGGVLGRNRANAGGSSKPLFGGSVTPKAIKTAFNITSSGGRAKNNVQSVAQFLGQYYSPEDLSTFQSTFDVPSQRVTRVVGSNDASDPGVEASLDIEYIMSTARGVPTWFVSTSGTVDGGQEPFLAWIAMLSNTSHAPLVNSVSYGDVESSRSPEYAARCNVEFMKNGVAGRSILFASGDDGVGCTSNRMARHHQDGAGGCVNVPNWPASSPYVTAVGGTVLRSLAPTQIESDSISSGGFSNYFGRPAYQDAAVQHYLKHGNPPPQSTFNISGRAYPDVASFSEDVLVVVEGETIPVGGTSCAAPVFSGVVSLINDKRLSAGKSPLGFLNPALYAAASNPSAFYDVVDGPSNGNSCCQGFNPVEGWDPITGLGAPNYPELLKALLAS